MRPGRRQRRPSRRLLALDVRLAGHPLHSRVGTAVAVGMLARAHERMVRICWRRWTGYTVSREVCFLYIVILSRMKFLGSANLYICGESGFVTPDRLGGTNHNNPSFGTGMLSGERGVVRAVPVTIHPARGGSVNGHVLVGASAVPGALSSRWPR